MKHHRRSSNAGYKTYPLAERKRTSPAIVAPSQSGQTKGVDVDDTPRTVGFEENFDSPERTGHTRYRVGTPYHRPYLQYLEEDEEILRNLRSSHSEGQEDDELDSDDMFGFEFDGELLLPDGASDDEVVARKVDMADALRPSRKQPRGQQVERRRSLGAVSEDLDQLLWFSDKEDENNENFDRQLAGNKSSADMIEKVAIHPGPKPATSSRLALFAV